MADNEILRSLLQAYVGGDLLARRALRDYLEETDDGRAAAVEQEAIDWDDLAWEIVHPGKRAGRPVNYDTEVARCRHSIDCARFNAGARPEVIQAVREARRRWLQGLFPEVDLPAQG
jgi:hypothetical protein